MTPDEYSIREFYLDVGDGHKIYVHDWGNIDAQYPIISIHGGPGSGSKDKFKINYNPKIQRVIFFDQRGAGKSLPYGELRNNDSTKLVEDIEKIIVKLQLDKVILVGGSWGSCLALLFGIKYPKRVKAMILNGIFTGRKFEIDYLNQGNFKNYFPDVWDEYISSVPAKNRSNPTEYHFKNIFSTDLEQAKKSAYCYSSLLEGPLVNLDDRFTKDKYEDYDYNPTKIEVYYLSNQCFLEDNYIFNNSSKLSMPIWLIQGRYDMVCPAITAYELNKLLANSSLIWSIGGHILSRESWSIMKILLETQFN